MAEAVAPARDRGLKSNGQIKPNKNKGRSRKGAWIEMIERSELAVTKLGRSRKGAWIEIT